MLAIPLAGMSTDIYLPSLPTMASHFAVNKAFAQYSVTVYALAMGIAQLLAGPVSDAYGRKKQLLIALLLQIASILLILHSPNIYWVIVARFFQGLGAAFMIVPGRAILNDVFTGAQLKKHFQYLTISFAMGPIIAPFIGGYLQEYIGWQANFYFILIYAIVLTCLIAFTFKETSQRIYPFSIDKSWKNYQIILSNKHFIVGSVLLGILIGYSGLFNVAGTFIIQKSLHQSAIVYGRIALLMGLGWFLGNIINRFTFNVDKELKTKVALSISFLTGVVIFILGLKGYFSLLTVIVPTFIMIMMSGGIFSTYVAECLTMFPELAASANGGLFAIVWTVFSVSTFIATLLKINSLYPLGLTYLLISAACILIYFGLLLPLERRSAS